MVLLKPSCDAMLDTGHIERAVVGRYTANDKQHSHQHFRMLVGNICMQCSAGFRTRHTGHVPRGLHKKGPPQK